MIPDAGPVAVVTPDAAPPPPPAECPPAPVAGTIEDPGGDALDKLYASLDDPQARTLVMQIGDSHTADDFFTGRLRHVLQQRFGDAGRGYLLAGKPVKHYYQNDAEYGSSGKWLAESGLHPERDKEPFGMAGYHVHSTNKKASAFVSTCQACAAGHTTAHFEIFFHQLLGGGTLDYTVDGGKPQKLSTKGDPEGTGRFKIDLPDGPHKLTLAPEGDAMVDLFGVALERDVPGVIVDSLGVVGARMWHLWKWDWKYVGEQITARDPRLVILAYGTNEEDDDQLDVDDLEDMYVDVIERVKQAAPDASILVLGPPDRGWREKGDACDPPHRRGHKPPPPPTTPAPGCDWRTPPVLFDIVTAERRAAFRERVAFFDLFTAMGGEDLMDGWGHATPALAYGDHTHLTELGYQQAADLLLKQLLDGYQQWKDAHAR